MILLKKDHRDILPIPGKQKIDVLNSSHCPSLYNKSIQFVHHIQERCITKWLELITFFALTENQFTNVFTFTRKVSYLTYFICLYDLF